VWENSRFVDWHGRLDRTFNTRQEEEFDENAHTNTNTHSIWKQRSDFLLYRDVLHPNRPNVSKDELREKLADLYKSNKDQVSVFGFRTQYGGGKSTGFALVYDSQEALKKFEPHYRMVRIGVAAKIEKPSRQQRTSLADSPVI
jgi:ribosomal protein S24E